VFCCYIAWRFYFDLESPKKPLVGLGVDLEIRRMSGENEVLFENLKVDVRSLDRTYSPMCHSRRMARAQTYGPECDRGLYFHQAVP
jgi:hypothetical protein